MRDDQIVSATTVPEYAGNLPVCQRSNIRADMKGRGRTHFSCCPGRIAHNAQFVTRVARRDATSRDAGQASASAASLSRSMSA
jgi:hypothetical protein